jgi:hypothetical protein
MLKNEPAKIAREIVARHKELIRGYKDFIKP